MKRIIIFLIRRRLGLKKMQRFFFSNQKSGTDRYYFTDTNLMKIHCTSKTGFIHMPSGCSLNWLLDDDIKIVKEENLIWL